MITDDEFDRLLTEEITPDCDPYMVGARALFGPNAGKRERVMVKLVFLRLFPHIAPRLIANTFEFSAELAVELKRRGLFDELVGKVTDKMRENDEKKNT